ncbi:MAG: L,D-transpeptidase family protein [Flavipsychrobacter sp.]|nr:L,D-transpeptidase family protein [Flavipsychrobacter sp.]
MYYKMTCTCFRIRLVLLLLSLIFFPACERKGGARSIFSLPDDAPAVDSTHPSLYEQTELQTPVDSLCVVKHLRRMYVYREGTLLKTYQVSLGTSPKGHKRYQGDRKTPEGLYYINGKNPNSMAHKNLGISYPNDADREFARKNGKSPGGDIKIHGMVNGWEAEEEAYRLTDWTWGCIAVRNREVDELYDYVEMGAPIRIVP